MTDSTEPLLDRRQFLRKAGVSGAVVAAGGVWLGHGSSRSAMPRTAARDGARPKRGGTLRAGLTGGTSADTLDANDGLNVVDFARLAQLYNPLVMLDDEALTKLVLAEEITPNDKATAWTIRLRSGVTFHNGKDLTADDVIFTLRRITNAKSPLPGAAGFSTMDSAGIKRLDALTLEVPFHTPNSVFDQTLAAAYYDCYIVPAGYDPHKPVGTGPFKYVSFTPGEESVFERNDDYWQAGLPYADQVVTTDFADETSQVNGLLSGQIDVVNLLDASAIDTVKNGGADVVISDGGGWTPFTMRVDVAPFNDVNVRQAMRWIVDRPEMLELIFAGHGTIGNDIFSIWDPAYDRAIPQRHQDIAYAKHLLKKAGHEDLHVTLVAADISQGTVEAAEVLQQQARAAGVTIDLRTVTSTTLYGPNYLKWTFAQDYWYYGRYVPQVSYCTLPVSPFNETHFDDPKYTSLYDDALATVDTAKRTEIAHEMQLIDYDSGGYIIPYFPPVVDGHARNVHGIVPCRTGIQLSNNDFANFWIG